MNIFIDMFDRLNNGESLEDLERSMKKGARRRSKERGKEWGVCDCCEQETCLVSETGMCGPCTFGEADTINGNW